MTRNASNSNNQMRARISRRVHSQTATVQIVTAPAPSRQAGTLHGALVLAPPPKHGASPSIPRVTRSYGAAMRIESSAISLSWIPSEAVTGANRTMFDSGIAHYDAPPPDVIAATHQ